MWKLLNSILAIFTISIKRFINEGYTYRVSALTYTTLLAIVPLAAVVVFFITLFPEFSSIINLTEEYIVSNFIPSSAQSIEIYFHNFISQASHLPIVSIIFLSLTSMMLIHTIEDTINDIWQVKKRRHKLFSWLFYWVILFIAPIVIALNVFITTYVSSLSWVIGIVEFLGLAKFFIVILSILSNTFFLAIIYIIVPNTEVDYRGGIIGAMIAAILLELAKIIFGFYVSNFPSYELIYGAFAAFPIFLIWLYVCWTIILLGAFISYTLCLPKTLRV